MLTHVETRSSNKLLYHSGSENLKGKLERAQQLHVRKKNAKEGAKTPARLKAYLSGVVPSCVISVDLRSTRAVVHTTLNSVNKEVTTERERERQRASEPEHFLQLARSVHTNTLPSFFPVCLRLHSV